MDTKQNDELDRLYSPSQWSHRYSKEEVISKHIQIITEGSKTALELFPRHELGVSYGQGEKQKCDILYPLSDANDAPILVFIHGGMWQSMDRTQYRLVATGFADAGFQVILAGYDLAPSVTMAEMAAEIEELGSFLLQKAAREGSSAVWVCGHSAGAHLTSLLLSHEAVALNPRFQGVILVSGLYDLEPLLKTSYNNALRLNSEQAKQVSSISRRIHSTHAHVLIVTAEHDSPAFKQQSKTYFEFLNENSGSFEFLEIKNADHFNIIEQIGNPSFELTVKIKELVKNSVKGLRTA